MIGRSAVDGWRYSSIMMNRTKGNQTCKEMQTPYKNYNLTFSEENGSSVYSCVARWFCTHPSQNDSHSADLCLSGSPRQHCCGGCCSRMVVRGDHDVTACS